MTNERRQASLPEDLEPENLEHMQVGDVAFTVPWAMRVDRERRCWLAPTYPAHEAPGGTVQMRVERRDDGYHAWPPGDERWQPESGDHSDHLPVAHLHREQQQS